MLPMLRFNSWLLLTTLLISAELRADVLNLNPPFGDSAYAAYSVFSPDNNEKTTYKDDIIVVLHGFLSAVPNGTFKRIRKKFIDTHTTLGLNYDPLDPEKTVAFLSEVAHHYLQDRRVTVIGTSLGGYWANYFGNKIQAENIVLLNPMVKPARQLARHLNDNKLNKRRGVTYKITQHMLDQYEAMQKPQLSDVATLLVLTEDDEQLPHETALNAYKDQSNTTIQIYEHGGHTLNLKKHQALQRIADYLYKD